MHLCIFDSVHFIVVQYFWFVHIECFIKCFHLLQAKRLKLSFMYLRFLLGVTCSVCVRVASSKYSQNVHVFEQQQQPLLELYFIFNTDTILHITVLPAGSITNHVSLERMDPKLTKWIGTLNASIGLQSVMQSNKIQTFALIALPFAFWKIVYVLVFFKKCLKDMIVFITLFHLH